MLERGPQPDVRYHLALAYALHDRIDQAVEQAKLLMKEQAGYPGLSTLTFRLALRQADLKLKQQDWNAISSAVALALETASPETEYELRRFQSVLPIANVKTGNRRDAAEAWERELRSQPENRGAIQNLAILYYWWALRQESAGGAADDLWMAAIAYWTAIVNSDRFWAAWKDELEQRWGLPLQDGDLQPVRDHFLEERLVRVFQNYSSSYKEAESAGGLRAARRLHHRGASRKEIRCRGVEGKRRAVSGGRGSLLPANGPDAGHFGTDRADAGD